MVSMAILSSQDIYKAQVAYCTDISTRREPFDVKREDLRLALVAIDAWVDENIAAFNAAIPQPARGQLTAKQKAELLMRVVRRRWEVS